MCCLLDTPMFNKMLHFILPNKELSAKEEIRLLLQSLMSCVLFRNPSEPLPPFCHDLAGCVSVLASIISYWLIKTIAIIEIPPHSLWS